MSGDTDKLLGKTIVKVEHPNEWDVALVFKDGTVATFKPRGRYDCWVGVEWSKPAPAEPPAE